MIAPPPVARPKLSVIVPVYNGELQLSRCLDALLASRFTDFEVIVVDDCSTDGSRQIVEQFAARYLRTPRNVGPGGARNLAARHAYGDVLLFVDSDVVVAPETVGQVAADFACDPQLAALFGSYDDQPAWRDFLSQYKNLMHHYVHQISSENASTFWAGCGAVRRDVYLEFGGFDLEKYPKPSIEDIEFGLRLWRAGRRIKLNKEIQVKHLKRWTLRGLLRADIFLRAVPWTRLILESGELPADLNLKMNMRVSALLVGLLVVALLAIPVDALGIVPGLTIGRIGIAAAVLVALLFALNWREYAWFARKRGAMFAAAAAIAHWTYYFYSGVTFALTTVHHKLTHSSPGGAPAAPMNLAAENRPFGERD